jgi:hypothetical protein
MLPPYKPNPIGVYPAFIWQDNQHEYPPHTRDVIRAQMLLDAVFRYRAAGYEPLPEWLREWEEIVARGISKAN